MFIQRVLFEKNVLIQTRVMCLCRNEIVRKLVPFLLLILKMHFFLTTKFKFAKFKFAKTV